MHSSWVDLGVSALADQAAVIASTDWSAAELARAARLPHAGRRQQFLAGRALLRQLLRQRFGDAADAWTISCEPDQPPRLQHEALALALSVSHSGGQVAAAIASGSGGIGIDLELPKPRRDLLGLAGFVASEPEIARLRALQGHTVALRQAFQHVWTLKEAAAKCSGAGLDFAVARTLELRERPLDDDSAASAHTWDHLQQRWTLALFSAQPMAASLIKLSAQGEIVSRRWSANAAVSTPRRPGRSASS